MKRCFFSTIVFSIVLFALFISLENPAEAFTSKILFTSNRDGNYEIYVMNPDGSNQNRLTNNSDDDSAPAWSTDGSKIVFESWRDGNLEIYVMDSDGSNQTNLTNNSASDNSPSWSPDGSQIVFYSKRDGNHEIYVMDADGSNPTNLTNNSANDYYPSWSPDGSKIAFNSYRDESLEIYAMNSDGSNQTRLTNNSYDDQGASWSSLSGDFRILSIVDVANDQGKQVSISWSRYPSDRPDAIEEIITNYSIWRKVDHNLPQVWKAAEVPEGNWHFVKEVPAMQMDSYNAVVPTLADSTINNGIYYSIFFVSAHTGSQSLRST